MKKTKTTKKTQIKKQENTNFKKRFLAFLVDWTLLTIIFILLTNPLKTMKISVMSSLMLTLLIFIIIRLLYEPLFIAKYGYTLGKYLTSCKVVNEKNKLLSYPRSYLRYICKYISFMTLGLGFLTIIFDKNKHGIHDMIIKTKVINIKEKTKKKNIFMIIILFLLLLFLAYNFSIANKTLNAYQTNLLSMNSDIINQARIYCEDEPWYFKDRCLSIFSYNPEMESEAIEDIQTYCSQISKIDLNTDCFAITSHYKKDEMCSNSLAPELCEFKMQQLSAYQEMKII